MTKVKFNAKLTHEIQGNWRILQSILQKHTVKKYVEVIFFFFKPFKVEKLMKCKYQDNLEFA